MKVTDDFFNGRAGWVEQLLLSVQILERANREWVRPDSIYKEQAVKTATWEASDGELRLYMDWPILGHQLLMEANSLAHRVKSYNPTEAIDVGLDRELTSEFKGIPIQDDLMTVAGLLTLEQRTAYLVHSWEIYQSFVAEWNAFADLQENLWIKIYRDEGLVTAEYTTPGAMFAFTEIAGLAGSTGGTIFYPETPGWIRDVGRAEYEAAVTQWLLDSGTTARSGGIATTNDSYIEWLADRLQEITIDRTMIATTPIDPRYVYRFAPIITPGASTGGDGGPSGVADSGSPDPAEAQKPGLDLLEELASRQNPLSAQLGDGGSDQPINTLPEC